MHIHHNIHCFSKTRVQVQVQVQAQYIPVHRQKCGTCCELCWEKELFDFIINFMTCSKIAIKSLC